MTTTALPVEVTVTWSVVMVALAPSISNVLIRPWLKGRSPTPGSVINANTESSLLGEKLRLTALASFLRALRVRILAHFIFPKTFVSILRVSGLVPRVSTKKLFLQNQSE